MEDLDEIRTNIINFQEKMRELNKNLSQTKTELYELKEEKQFLVEKNSELHEDISKKKQLISEFEKKVNILFKNI